MIIYHRSQDIDRHLREIQKQGTTVGFVPTMGALHHGHLSLVEEAKQENDVVVTSIFVNPTQFNEPDDFKKYPRTLAPDADKLIRANCHFLFVPSEDDVYPEKEMRKQKFDLGGLDIRLEGAYRPGHFKGVAQVVSRLMDIVHPDTLYLGQKDFQQFRVLEYLLLTLQKRPVKVKAAPIVREEDGLAMSSRNVLLTDEERKSAVILNQCLQKTLDSSRQHAPEPLQATIEELLLAEPMIEELDYFELVDAETLKPIHHWEDAENVVALVAAKFPSARLIDNTLVKESGRFRTTL